MGLTRLWCGADARRRWRQYVTLVVMIAFVGAVVLTCAAAARRTDSTFARYTEHQGLADIEVYSSPDPEQVPKILAAIEGTPGVARSASYNTVFAAPDLPDVIPAQDFLMWAPNDDRYGRTVDRPLVVEGRLPDPDAPDEVVVNVRGAEDLGLHVGSVTRIQSMTPEEGELVLAGDFDNIHFAGPKPTVRVVGIVRGRADLFDVSYARRYYITSHAFYEQNKGKIFGFGELVQIEAEPDVGAHALGPRIAKAVNPDAPEEVDVSYLDDPSKGLQDSANVQAIALLLVAGTALAAGAVAISQAIGRSLTLNSGDFETLGALGVDRRSRVLLGAAIYLPVALLGTVIGVAAAWFASRWFPTGTAREAEVSLGAQFDVRVLLGGAFVVVVAVVARAAFGTWRQATARGLRPDARRSLWLERLTASLAPPIGTGVRWAVGRRDGTHAHTRSALVGAMVGVAGLLAVVVYTSGLDHAVEPAEWGWTFDANAGGGSNPDEAAQVQDAVLDDEAVGDVASVWASGGVGIDDDVVQGLAYERVRGRPIGPTVVEGEAPVADDEVLLGTKTAEELGVEIGDVVKGYGKKGDRPIRLRVVGLGLLPSIESDQFTSGAVTTHDTWTRLQRFDGGYQNTLFRWKPGTDVDTAVARMRDNLIPPTLAAPPSDIENLDVVRDYPRLLAAFLVVLGILATVHGLVISTRRRRHEMGVLRALGFSRRQVANAVSAHGTTIGIVAVVIGVPLGYAAGRTIWVSQAERIGLATAAPASVLAALAITVGTVALTWAIATAAGARASRVGVSAALRVE